MSRMIRVDDEVFAKLQALAEPFVDTPNTALRKLLDLPTSPSDTETCTPGTGRRDQSLRPLLANGRLRVGQELVWRRRNLDRTHTAVVLPDGALRLPDGSTHDTPSGAATYLAGNPQNGWNAWSTESGARLKELR